MFCIFESPGQLHGNSVLLHAGISFDSHIKLFSIGIPAELFKYYFIKIKQIYVLIPFWKWKNVTMKNTKNVTLHYQK